ncbi:MAG TPA: hypothetical protein DEA75_10545 [Rhodobacteraceae bacterium]|nr:hypothetical protein [Paracoccaceae bacterium]
MAQTNTWSGTKARQVHCCGALIANLSHNAYFYFSENVASSNCGIKHLAYRGGKAIKKDQ